MGSSLIYTQGTSCWQKIHNNTDGMKLWGQRKLYMCIDTLCKLVLRHKQGCIYVGQSHSFLCTFQVLALVNLICSYQKLKQSWFSIIACAVWALQKQLVAPACIMILCIGYGNICECCWTKGVCERWFTADVGFACCPTPPAIARSKSPNMTATMLDWSQHPYVTFGSWIFHFRGDGMVLWKFH